ncbi:MAG: transglutaminase domain-containing protein [Chloroflexi bacterium]|nr:MAG: transglutaminase domain-containing protein [Chloroflexota bacterium]
MDNGVIATTTTTRSNGWPAITVLLVQLGLQWVLAHQIVGAGWVSGTDFLPLLAVIAVIATTVTVWVWRTDSLLATMGVGVIGAGALVVWMAPLVRADVANTLGEVYAARLNGYLDISYEIILHSIAWWHTVTAGQASSDAVMFVVVLAVLTYLLAAVSTWVLLRAHAVWISIGISVIPLLVNYAFAPRTDATSIGVFVGGAIVLVALNQIHWHEVTWRDNQVERPQQTATQLLGQAVGIICLALVIAALLPIPARDTRVLAGWDALRTPIKSAQQAWGWMLGNGITNTPATGGIGGFANTTMTVGGARNLGQTEVLRLRSSAPDYLRATTFDGYTGQGWSQQAPSQDTTVDRDIALTDNPQADRLVQSEITLATPARDGMLLSIGQPLAYTVAVTVTHLANLPSDGDSIVAIRGRAIQQYQLMSAANVAPADALRTAPAPNDAIRTIYTALPATLPPQIGAYAQTIVATAQATTAYDQAVAVETALRTLRYDEQRPAPPTTSDWVDYFLFTSRRGYCDDFATAMVVLLRTQGIPARLAQGYAMGTPDGTGALVVREAQAHSWVEVYFEGYGWQRFEPTPAGYTTTRSPNTAPNTVATAIVVTPQFTAVAPTFFPNNTPQPLPTAIPTVTRTNVPREQAPQPTDMRWVGWLIGLLVSAGLTIAAVAWWRSRTSAQRIRMQYGGIWWLYQYHGMPLATRATANDVAQLTAATLPVLADMVGAVCAAYNQLQYAGQSSTQVPAVAWHTLWWQLWRWRWHTWRNPPHGRG